MAIEFLRSIFRSNTPVAPVVQERTTPILQAPVDSVAQEKFRSIADLPATAVASSVELDKILLERKWVSLDLSRSGLTDEAFQKMESYLKGSTTLEVLRLSGNQLTYESAVILARVLRVNSCLKVLEIDYNSFGDEGAALLFEALKENNTLLRLSISENYLGGASYTALANLIRVNATLVEVWIQNRIDIENSTSAEKGLRDLQKVLETTKRQIRLQFDHSYFSPLSGLTGRIEYIAGMDMDRGLGVNQSPRFKWPLLCAHGSYLEPRVIGRFNN